MRRVVLRMWQCLMQRECVTNKAEGVIRVQRHKSVLCMQQLGSSESI